MIEGVVITGGEPSLYKDLDLFMKEIKDKGLKIKLDTNGSNPDQLESLLKDELVDYVAIDVKTSLEKYEVVAASPDAKEKVKRSISIVMSDTVPYELRTTCVPKIICEDDFYSIRETVKGAKKYCLQQFRPMTTYDKNFEQITPYQKEDLIKFKNILEGYAEQVEIRGV